MRGKYRMMRTGLIIIILLAVIALPSTGTCRPVKGFNTGPYLAFEIGGMQMDYDKDQVSGEKICNDFEISYGFLFGWSFTDAVSAELQGRYSTQKKSNKREHIASANVYGRWSIITDALTDFKNLRILPFLKGGMAVRVSALPGNSGSSDGVVGDVGWGPSIGGGLSFILHKYFYFGVDLQGDMLMVDNIHQTVNGVPNTLVYKGGFYPQFSGMVMLGVHY